MRPPSGFGTFSRILGFDFPDDSFIAFAAGFAPASFFSVERTADPCAKLSRPVRKNFSPGLVIISKSLGLDFEIDLWCESLGPGPQFISQNKGGGRCVWGCAFWFFPQTPFSRRRTHTQEAAPVINISRSRRAGTVRVRYRHRTGTVLIQFRHRAGTVRRAIFFWWRELRVRLFDVTMLVFDESSDPDQLLARNL